jgi:hypothetical protein
VEQPTRTAEGFTLGVAAAPPQDGVVLARLVRGRRGWSVDRRFAVARLRRR